MSCNEICHSNSTKGKVYAVAELTTTEARTRLAKLDLDDQTEIARIEISARRRLYGFLHNGAPTSTRLWWDLEHKIWPSRKKHT